MNGEYAWWFLVVGLVIGGALVWLVRGQMAREEEDIAESEREPEAEWISRAIERAGGVAPADLVAQVLALHRDYLREAEPFAAPPEDAGDVGEPSADQARPIESAADESAARTIEPTLDGAAGRPDPARTAVVPPHAPLSGGQSPGR